MEGFGSPGNHHAAIVMAGKNDWASTLRMPIALKMTSHAAHRYDNRSSISPCARSSALICRTSARDFRRSPPAVGIAGGPQLPPGVLGPVECSHGFQR